MVVPRFDSGQSTRGGTPNGLSAHLAIRRMPGLRGLSSRPKSERSPAHSQICSQSLICLCRLCSARSRKCERLPTQRSMRFRNRSIRPMDEDSGELDLAVNA